MELFDIVDENGNPTGKIVKRTEAHEKGIRHRTAHVWIMRYYHHKEEVLLQKRAMNKDSFPGRYDTSSAGHVPAGAAPLDSAIRELKEELGINAKPEDLIFAGKFQVNYEKTFHDKIFKDKEIAFVYIYLKRVRIEDLTIQKEELDCVEWFDIKEVFMGCKEHNPKFCVPLKGLELAKKCADEERFKYGYQIDAYIEKAIEELRKTYRWVTKESLSKCTIYTIEQRDGEFEFVSYHKFKDGRIEDEVHKCSAEMFIDTIVYDNNRYLFSINKVVDTYKLKICEPICTNGWYLERYEFNKHQSGDYSTFVQAGNRVTGGSCNFQIPPNCMDGDYEEFLDKYLKIVTPASYGITREHLQEAEGLKEFLGFA